MGNPVLGTHVSHNLHHVTGKLRNGIIAGRMEIRLGTVIIHGQAAAHVQRAQRGALLHQVHVNADRLRQPLAHHGNIWNLGPLMIMEQLQAIQRIHLLQLIHHIHHLGCVQPENGLIPRGFLP